MRNLKFIEHTGNAMPKELSMDTMIVYRTTSTATPVSHVHMPRRAGDLNWDDDEQYIGSILEYSLIPVANSAFYIDNDDSAEFIPLITAKE